MQAFEFNKMDLVTKAMRIATNGRMKATYDDERYMYTLYQLHDFFVEVKKDKHSQDIQAYTASDRYDAAKTWAFSN